MSIFNIEKTQQEIKLDEMRRCAEYRNGARGAHESAFLVSFNDFWNNPIVSPQEHCDALGNKAYQLFQTSAITAKYLMTLNPEFVMPTIPYDFTINEDWTVTIGEKIVIEPEIPEVPEEIIPE